MLYTPSLIRSRGSPVTAEKISLCETLKFLGVVTVKMCRKSTRCCVLNQVAEHARLIIKPPLNDIHKENRMKRTAEYMKTDISAILFTGECHVILNETDVGRTSWVDINRNRPQRLRR